MVWYLFCGIGPGQHLCLLILWITRGVENDGDFEIDILLAEAEQTL